MARHARQPPPGGLSAAGPAPKAVPEAITTNAIVAASKAGRHSAQAPAAALPDSPVAAGAGARTQKSPWVIARRPRFSARSRLTEEFGAVVAVGRLAILAAPERVICEVRRESGQRGIGPAAAGANNVFTRIGGTSSRGNASGRG
jgi:hypothetical protein